MGKTKYLKDFLKARLEEITSRPVFYVEANQCTPPYVVYHLENVKNGVKNDILFEVNLWDLKSYDEIEDLADLIEKALDRTTHLDDNMQVTIYITSNKNVEDPDKRVKRRRLTFDIHHYERGN